MGPSQQAPDGQQAALPAGRASVRPVAWPRVSDAHRVRGVRRAHGVRRWGLRDAPDALTGPLAARHAARVQQPEEQAGWDVASGQLPGVSAALDAEAVQLQGPDAPVQLLEAQAERHAARRAVRHVVAERPREAQVASDALLAARREHQRAERDVALRRAAVPLAAPLVRLLLRVARPARAGLAHRRSMRKMQSMRSASHRTQSSPAGRDEVLS